MWNETIRRKRKKMRDNIIMNEWYCAVNWNSIESNPGITTAR